MRTDEEMRELWLPKMRAGRFRFVLKFGILGWGVPLGIFMGVLNYLLSTNGLRLSTALVYSLIIGGIVGGTSYGIFLWYYIRRRYRLPAD